MPDEPLPIPDEVPWRLAATSQVRTPDGPSGATVALFHHEPDTPSLAEDYPGERVVYVKASVSLSPEVFEVTAPSMVARNTFAGAHPVWHALVDVTVEPATPTADGERPYVHAVAPMQRQMIRTGVIGNDVAEGVSNAIAVGRSASQLHEEVYTEIHTSSAGRSMDLGIVGGSGSRSTTGVATDRTVNEFVDSTYRESSTERRELTSHLTNIANVYSLLQATHVGSPYTRFSLWPRPISLLSVDAGDPLLWHGELLRRRSSGLEGVQELFLVLVVPDGERFCVTADLKRFMVLDLPPYPPVFDAGFGDRELGDGFDDLEDRVYRHLYRRYPKGTPVEDLPVALDIDRKLFPRAAVDHWGVRWEASVPSVVTLVFRSPVAFAEELTGTNLPSPLTRAGGALYQTFQEALLDAVLADHQEEAARSPFERGIVFGKGTRLRVCLDQPTGGGLSVVSRDAETYDVGYEVPEPPAPMSASASASEARRGRAAVERWNLAQDVLSATLHARTDWSSMAPQLSDARVVGRATDLLARLPSGHAANAPIDDVLAVLGLPPEVERRVRASGAEDLAGVVRVARDAPALAARHRRDVRASERLRRVVDPDGRTPDGDLITVAREPVIDTDSAAAITTALAALWSGGEPDPPQ